ncbi:helix-turn-helix domain-containing protein [Pseudomonas putida]|uniref:helix-turn-helix domain-containing protein n=1 Tax=Pseudomonas putida TaxID=303 RepID=UPI002363A117|nr:helix-turn-helix transcriptional regulator [Pseudomonas putida]MDD2139622.1 helix-turn-helix domain-containing protein [Pseudomonas putida]HDS1721545.1 helix-turn-helix transcriptional regulator [Pseudomonas putida]
MASSVSSIIREEEGSRLRVAYQRMKITKRITQADIARACGWTSASTFNRVLSGKIPLTLDSVTKLAEALGVNPASISPRLIQEKASDQESKSTRFLPVSSVKDVRRGCWGEPFMTTLRFPFFTADHTAFAITFDEVAPAGLEGWVVIVEPGSKPAPGDRVVVKQSPGKYAYGLLSGSDVDGAYAVDVEGLGKILTTAKRCMLVVSLGRKGDLRDFRACAENPSG